MNENIQKNSPTSAVPLERFVMPFINLSNGLLAIREYDLNINDVRFIRIQSTACEQKRWEYILNCLSPDFFMLVALGYNVVIYDYGAKKETPRAIWQGLEWIKFVLHKRWHGNAYAPKGRAKSMIKYFDEQYMKLGRNTKKMLDYYKKFSREEISINSVTSSTTNDGDIGLQRSILFRA